MAPKQRDESMPCDDLLWEISDGEVEIWEKSLHKAEIYRAIASLITKYRPGEAVKLHRPIRGGYNIVFRLEYKDGSSVAMRIPRKGIVKFPDEKVRYEVATMRYIAAQTTIPVPQVYHFGTAAENPTGLGPFIIMEYIEHERTMSEAMIDPDLEFDAPHVLDSKISEQKLEFLYRQMADILLQLSTARFPRIGSLVEEKDGRFSVSGRPITDNMNTLLEFTGLTPALLPSQPCSTSNKWYSALADMHLAQLTFQHNGAVDDEDDARDKYVARQLFRQLASQGKLGVEPELDDSHGNARPFILYSEDLHPSNVLIDKDLRVVGVIDWEFAYAAPAQFSFDPPWWLLLGNPERWPGGYRGWMEAYEPRLETFLGVLEEEEGNMRARAEIESSMAGLSLSSGRGVALSQRMRKSWEDKTWMISYAARNSWEFDWLFWKFLDARYFGPNEEEDHGVRLELLTEKQKEAMEAFVQMKMEQDKERIRVEWDDESAAAELAKVMV
ncbi:phosphotransferase family protein [Nemania sp. NC0429]|nr:phosphotransferase family protein [Nemania sp. NC0429]